MTNLAGRTLFGFAALMLVLALALFVPAGTLDFWPGWVWLFIFAASSALITAYLWQKDPLLLERRVHAGPTAEKEQRQRLIQVVASVAFIGLIVLPPLDHRFAWSHVPPTIVIIGDVTVAVGFFIIFLVFRENTFTSATIEVAADQQVVSSGPYRGIRHPMYAGALLMLLATPLALGSWWGLVMFIPMAFAIIWRLIDEEQFLAKNLHGYNDYCHRVRYRLIPGIW